MRDEQRIAHSFPIGRRVVSFPSVARVADFSYKVSFPGNCKENVVVWWAIQVHSCEDDCEVSLLVNKRLCFVYFGSWDPLFFVFLLKYLGESTENCGRAENSETVWQRVREKVREFCFYREEWTTSPLAIIRQARFIQSLKSIWPGRNLCQFICREARA